MTLSQSASSLRVDLRLIAEMVSDGARVLDVGCGDGSLLAWLGRHKNVDGRGIELSMSGVAAAVAQGLSVIQGDADTDLSDYPDDAFDFVILSQTLQATRDPRAVLSNMLRIGRRAIVSFPNFGHWRLRLDLMVNGRMPVTDSLAYEWYETPNIHFCTIRDFLMLCSHMGISVERAVALNAMGRPLPAMASGGLSNLLAAQGLFLLARLS